MTRVQRISEHVYWLAPGPPDRPSLAAVAGARRTLMLDAGSSAAHTRLFLDGLADEAVEPPALVVLTHSHWDHVFGAAELAVPVIAHKLTAEALGELASTDWGDEALDRRVAAGEATPAHAANVKQELPSPRSVQIAPADIVFQEGLDLDLGDVAVQVRHVGSDHAADSSVMHVEPDGVLFLGDCLYEAPSGGYTAQRLARLTDAVLAFEAELYVEGHSETVLARTQIDQILGEASRTVAR